MVLKFKDVACQYQALIDKKGLESVISCHLRGTLESNHKVLHYKSCENDTITVTFEVENIVSPLG